MRGADFKAKYKVAELLDILKSNRSKHKEAYDKATINYKRELIEKLSNMLDTAKRGKKVDHNIDLRTPVQYLKQYDNVISMLEKTCDEEIVLDSDQFSQLVLDDWGWTHDFEAATVSYASKKYR